MASDPSQLLMYLTQNAGLNGIQADEAVARQRLQQQQIAGNALQLQQAQQQVQAQQQQAQAFQAWQQDYLRSPTPDKLAKAAILFPDQAAAFQKSWDMQNDQQKQSNLNTYGQIWEAANNNRPQLVTQQLTALQRARQEAGQDTSSIDDALRLLQSSNPDDVKQGLNATKGITQVILAQDPDAAKTLGWAGSGDDGTWQSAGDGVIFNNKSAETRRVGSGSKTIQVPIYDTNGHRVGTQLVSEGGDPVSGGAGGASSPGTRYTGGWTPRAANGGDNPDNVVDNKIAGAAKFLGVSPGDDISKVSPMKLAQAMTLSEGGVGSLADRNNNPANIRNADGSYKTFPSKQAGLNAAAALVARKLKNGQTTVQSLIEGVPANGGQSAQSGYYGPVGGNQSQGSPFGIADNLTGHDVIAALPPNIGRQVQAMLDGRQQLTARQASSPLGQQLIAAANQADPQFDTTNYNARAKVRNSFTSGPDAKNVTSLGTSINHMAELLDSFNKLQNGSIPLFNRIGNTWARAWGNGGAQKAFNANVQAVSDELETTFRGSSGTLAGTESWKDAFDAADSPQTFREVLHKAYSLLQGRADELTDKFSRGIGHQADVSQFLSPVAQRNAAMLAQLGPSAQGQNASSNVSPPPGAKQIGMYKGAPLYQLPDGRKWTP